MTNNENMLQHYLFVMFRNASRDELKYANFGLENYSASAKSQKIVLFKIKSMINIIDFVY